MLRDLNIAQPVDAAQHKYGAPLVRHRKNNLLKARELLLGSKLTIVTWSFTFQVNRIDRYMRVCPSQATPAPMIGKQVVGDSEKHAPQVLARILTLISQQTRVSLLREICRILVASQSGRQDAQEFRVIAAGKCFYGLRHT